MISNTIPGTLFSPSQNPARVASLQPAPERPPQDVHQQPALILNQASPHGPLDTYRGECMWPVIYRYQSLLSPTLQYWLLIRQQFSYRDVLRDVRELRDWLEFKASELWNLAKALFFEARDRFGIPSGGIMAGAEADERYRRYDEVCDAAADVYFISLFTHSVPKSPEEWKIADAILPSLPARLRPFRALLVEDWLDRAKQSQLDELMAHTVLSRYTTTETLSCKGPPHAQAVVPAPPPYNLSETLKAHWAPRDGDDYLLFLLDDKPFDALLSHLLNPNRQEFARPLFEGIWGVALHCLALANNSQYQATHTALQTSVRRLVYLSLFLRRVPDTQADFDKWIEHWPAVVPTGLERTVAQLMERWKAPIPPALQATQVLVLQRYGQADQ